MSTQPGDAGKLDVRLGDGEMNQKYFFFCHQFIQSNLAQEINQTLIACVETTNSCTSESIIWSVLLITATFRETKIRVESTGDG